MEGQHLGSIQAHHGVSKLPMPPGIGSVDILVSFNLTVGARGFGVSVRSGEVRLEVASVQLAQPPEQGHTVPPSANHRQIVCPILDSELSGKNLIYRTVQNDLFISETIRLLLLLLLLLLLFWIDNGAGGGELLRRAAAVRESAGEATVHGGTDTSAPCQCDSVGTT